VNVQETLAIIEALKAAGASHFKSQDFEITMGSTPQKLAITQQHIDPSPEQSKAVVEATDKLKNLMNTINMSPEELANKMFPDGAI
jgi:hypothetical protein